MKCLHCGQRTEFSVGIFGNRIEVPMCLLCQRWMRQNPVEAVSVLKNLLGRNSIGIEIDPEYFKLSADLQGI